MSWASLKQKHNAECGAGTTISGAEGNRPARDTPHAKSTPANSLGLVATLSLLWCNYQLLVLAIPR